MLTYLASVSKGPAQKFEILSQLVSSLFDLNPVMATHLKTSLWKRVIITLLDMLKLLQVSWPTMEIGRVHLRRLNSLNWQNVDLISG